MRRRLAIGLVVLGVSFGIAVWRVVGAVPSTQRSVDGSTTVAVEINGGYETDPRDRGRPVVLVAAGLGVPEDVFREAFRHVRPAPAGERPSGDRVHSNKRALLDALGKYGVTNERLDEVSDYYRYRPGDDELWRHVPASAVAHVKDGRVTNVVVTEPGAGYSSAPTVTVPGYPDVRLIATVAFGKDLKTNGKIESVRMVDATTKPTSQPTTRP